MDDIQIVNIAAKLCIIPKRARNFINAFATLSKNSEAIILLKGNRRTWSTCKCSLLPLCLNALDTLCMCYLVVSEINQHLLYRKFALRSLNQGFESLTFLLISTFLYDFIRLAMEKKMSIVLSSVVSDIRGRQNWLNSWV